MKDELLSTANDTNEKSILHVEGDVLSGCTRLLSKSIAHREAAELFFRISNQIIEHEEFSLGYLHEALYSFCCGYMARLEQAKLKMGKTASCPISYLLAFEDSEKKLAKGFIEAKKILFSKANLAQVCYDARFGKAYERAARRLIRKKTAETIVGQELYKAMQEQVSLDVMIKICSSAGHATIDTYDHELDTAFHNYEFPPKKRAKK